MSDENSLSVDTQQSPTNEDDKQQANPTPHTTPEDDTTQDQPPQPTHHHHQQQHEQAIETLRQEYQDELQRLEGEHANTRAVLKQVMEDNAHARTELDRLIAALADSSDRESRMQNELMRMQRASQTFGMEAERIQERLTEDAMAARIQAEEFGDRLKQANVVMHNLRNELRNQRAKVTVLLQLVCLSNTKPTSAGPITCDKSAQKQSTPVTATQQLAQPRAADTIVCNCFGFVVSRGNKPNQYQQLKA